MQHRSLLPVVAAFVAVGLSGCGSSAARPVGSVSPVKSTTTPPPTTDPTKTEATPPSTTERATTAQVGPLVAEAQSAAAGDIPDNQVFLTLTNAAAGYTIRYPEGWAQTGSGPDVTVRDRSTIMHVVVTSGPPPTTISVAVGLGQLAGSSPTLHVTRAPVVVRAGRQVAVKAVYETVSEPSPVTGKRVALVVDRYVLSHAGMIMVVDLGAQKGVDNVDAFRLMIDSVRWTS